MFTPASAPGPPVSKLMGCAVWWAITSSPGRACARSAISLHMVPDGRNTAASLPRSSATISFRRLTVGSSSFCSSPTSASHTKRRMSAVGRVTVSLDRYLTSDTVTRPTADMRRFVCEAEVGDEQKLEDPTVNLLNEMVAELLGKEAAVFLPSGTMCNEIALRAHARPGEEVIAHHTAHPINFETGGPGALARVNMRAIHGARGQFDAAAVEAAVRPPSRYAPRTRLVWVEQTSNLGSGSVWPLQRLEAGAAAAERHGLATHMDGARLMNAVVASGVSARDYAAPFDSAWIDFTKGLGAPVGAALAGSRAFIDEAWRCKQQMGGAMRQAGIIAAGGVYALRHHGKRRAGGP